MTCSPPFFYFLTKKNKHEKSDFIVSTFGINFIWIWANNLIHNIRCCKSKTQDVLAGVTTHATHIPTGTQYTSVTNKNGVYVLPAVRVGGPYTIHASIVGFEMGEEKDVNTQLGLTSNIDFVLIDKATSLKEVVVVGTKSGIFSKEKTGAAQQFGRRELTTIPITGARTIDGITKYDPFGNGNSFGAQDSR